MSLIFVILVKQLFMNFPHLLAPGSRKEYFRCSTSTVIESESDMDADG